MRETSLNATYYSDRIRVTSFDEGCWSYVGAQTLIAANRRDLKKNPNKIWNADYFDINKSYMLNCNFAISKNDGSDINFILKMTSRSNDVARGQFFKNGAFEGFYRLARSLAAWQILTPCKFQN